MSVLILELFEQKTLLYFPTDSIPWQERKQETTTPDRKARIDPSNIECSLWLGFQPQNKFNTCRIIIPDHI